MWWQNRAHKTAKCGTINAVVESARLKNVGWKVYRTFCIKYSCSMLQTAVYGTVDFKSINI